MIKKKHFVTPEGDYIGFKLYVFGICIMTSIRYKAKMPKYISDEEKECEPEGLYS